MTVPQVWGKFNVLPKTKTSQSWATKHICHLFLAVWLIILPWYFHNLYWIIHESWVVSMYYTALTWNNMRMQVVGVKWKQNTKKPQDLWIWRLICQGCSSQAIATGCILSNVREKDCVCFAVGCSGNVTA